MLITSDIFSQVAGRPLNDNMASAMRGLENYGEEVALYRPHRLAMFLAQTAHESMGWKYDREIWGPTAAQKRYEGRKDLGNVYVGDGSKFRGYTPIQITGRRNTTKFYEWCKKRFKNVPNFVEYPHLMNTDPWEGLAALWYWSEGKSVNLNIPADKGDFREVTRLINGGYNGLEDRYRYYGRAGLVLMGRHPSDMKAFQKDNSLVADGIAGPSTARVLHNKLYTFPSVRFNAKSTTSISNGALSNFFTSFMNLFRRT